MECLRHFDGIVPSVASILTKQYNLHGGKYLLKTPENAISETQKTQNVPRCLSPQELGPLVQLFDSPVDMFVRLCMRKAK